MILQNFTRDSKMGGECPIYQTQHGSSCHSTKTETDLYTTTNKFISSTRLIGPPEDYASSQWFIKGNEESIYGKLYKNNMDGLSSFYPVAEGLDYLVKSDNEVALFEFINLHSYQEYQCKVRSPYVSRVLK